LQGQAERMDTMIMEGRKLRSQHPDSAIAIFNKVEIESEKIDYLHGEVYAYYLAMKLDMYSKIYSEHNEKLASFYNRVQGTDLEKMGAELDCIRGTIAAQNGLIDTSMLYLNRSIKWFLDNDMIESTSISYLELAKIYLKKNDKGNAKQALENAYKATASSKAMRRYIVLYNIVEIALLAEEYESYNLYLQKMMKVGKSFNIAGDSDVGHNLAQMILGIKDKRLEQKLKDLVPVQIRQNRKDLLISTYYALSSIATDKGDEKAALAYLQENKKYVSNLSQRAILYKSIYENRKSIGDNKVALVYLENYNLCQDTMFLDESQANVDRLQVELQTIEKDYELKIKTRQRNYLLSGLLLVSLFGLFVFWNLRKRNMLNAKIFAQQKNIDRQHITQLENENKISRSIALLEGQETERARIAQDLHDGLGGLLSTVKVHYVNIIDQVDKLKKIKGSGRIENMIDEACTEVRRISHDLMPNILKLDGLKSSIESIALELRSVHKLHVDLDIRNLTKLEDKKKEIFIYRITQELCNNIVKYAKADKVLIQLQQYEKEIVMLIEDDGVGFVYEDVIKKKSLGLQSTISRVEFLNGIIDINSSPGKGTSVTINIPIEK